MILYLSLALDVYDVPFPDGQSEFDVLLAEEDDGEDPSKPGRSTKD